MEIINLNVQDSFDPHRTISFEQLAMSAEFGHEARRKRYLIAYAVLSECPGKSFPKAFWGNTALTATYRFLRNPNVNMQKLLEPHILFSIERLKGVQAVLIAHDTTVLKFSHDDEEMHRDGFEKKSTFTSSINLHISYAAVYMDNILIPVGIVAASTFEAKPKEGSSYDRWYKQAVEVDKLIKSRHESINVIHIMDREADSYEMMSDFDKINVNFVIRMCSRERLVFDGSNEKKLSDLISRERENPDSKRLISLSSRSKNRGSNAKKKHPPRKERSAEVSIYSKEIKLKRPKRLDSATSEDLEVFYVECIEEQSPSPDEEIYWGIFCSKALMGKISSDKIVDIYAGRWIIEELNKAIKSGCAIEERQVQSIHTMENTIALLLPFAHRLLQSKWMYHVKPDAPASDYFSSAELNLLSYLRGLKPGASIREATIAVAEMGGYQKRPSTVPGWQTITSGFQELLKMLEGYALVKNALSSQKLYDG